MNSKKLICLATLSMFFPLAAHAQTLLQDDFRGTKIDTSKWVVSAQKGTITQNNKLIFNIKNLPPAPYYYRFLYDPKHPQKGGGWNKLYMVSRAAFPRVKADKVLRLTLDVELSAYAMNFLGFFPDTEYQDAEDPKSGMKYGFHGNRLDRALWFMQGPVLNYKIPQAPENGRILRLTDSSIPYHSYRVRLELGAVDGALWQYDMGEGWKTGRDTRGEGTGDRGKIYKFFVSTAFYGDGSMLVDKVRIDYITATGRRHTDSPHWPPPVNAEFNGKMDERWTNWAGDLGVWWTTLSVADFRTAPGWLVLHGPAGGYGMFLRHYPFAPRKPYPFFAETHLRYPTIAPPRANYLVMGCMLIDVDSDPYVDDLAYSCLQVQNILAAKKTQMRVETSAAEGQTPFLACKTSAVDLPTYWDSGDLYLRIGLKDARTMAFSYKFKQDRPWQTFYTYEAPGPARPVALPIGFDLMGPCAGSVWPKPPSPEQCKADEVSYEVDYVHFSDGSSSAPENASPK